MRKLFPTESIFQIFSLLVAFILIHALYVALIRPNAEVFVVEERAKMAIDSSYEIKQSPYVIVRDYEQETCFVLMLWALAIIGFKTTRTYRQRRQLDLDLVGIPEDTPVTFESAQQISALIRKRLPEQHHDYLLPRVMLAAIDRFSATRSIQDASNVVQTVCVSEAERLDSDLSIIRYIAWAIPAIGFIGTVRGIGNALAQANQAIQGDITGVTDSLGQGHCQRRQLDLDLVGIPEDTPVTFESAQQTSALIRKRLPEQHHDYLLPRVMLAAIDRFSATRSIQDASNVVQTVCVSEAERLDSDLSIIRYIAWAIPAIGFIGTVRGIGNALAQANQAIQGDITGVTDSLGVAFNSTFIALLISIVLMFLVHQLQSMQEKFVLDTQRYCDDWFVRRLKV